MDVQPPPDLRTPAAPAGRPSAARVGTEVGGDRCRGLPSVGIPGLRTWQIARFPLLWFCLERDDHLDVVRLLGERQDIAAILGAEFAAN